MPENTRIAYETTWNQFAGRRAGYGRVLLPATPQTLTQYVNTLITVEAEQAYWFGKKTRTARRSKDTWTETCISRKG